MKIVKVAKSKCQELKDLKNLAATLSQLYVANQVRGGYPTAFFSHENVSIPPSISKDGHLCHGSKSDLVQVLIDTSEKSTTNDLPEVDAIVIDGPAIAHTITLKKNGSIIDEYCELYIRHIKDCFDTCSRVDVVFDVYIPFSLKEAVRASRGVAPSMIVKGSTKVKNWTRFLKNDENEQSLFQYIASYAHNTSIPLGKQLVITCHDGVITNPHRGYLNEEPAGVIRDTIQGIK